MKTLRHLILAAALAAALILLPALSHAQNFLSYGTQSLLSGGTNNVAAATTNTYSSVVNCHLQENVGVALSFAATGTNTSTIVFRLKPSLDATTTDNVGTAFDISVAANGTNTVSVVTNLSVGAIGYLVHTKVENPNATSAITNVTLSYSLKK